MVPREAREGLAPEAEGLAPVGLTPEGLAPEGVAPEGVAPEGVAPTLGRPWPRECHRAGRSRRSLAWDGTREAYIGEASSALTE